MPGPIGTGGGGGSGSGAPTTVPYITTAADATLSAEVAIPALASSPDRAGKLGGGGTNAGTSEEWDTTTTGLTWAPSTPNTVDANTTIYSHLYVKSTANVTYFGTKAFAPSGAFDVRLPVKAAVGAVLNVSWAGLWVGEDATGTKGCGALVKVGANTVEAYTRTGGVSGAVGSSYAIGRPIAVMRITRDASNNITYWWSPDGTLFQVFATGAFTMTVAKVGIWLQTGTISNVEAAFDWLRTDV